MTDFYRKTMPIPKIVLNLKPLTILGCGIGIEVLNRQYMMFKISHIQNTFVINPFMTETVIT